MKKKIMSIIKIILKKIFKPVATINYQFNVKNKRNPLIMNLKNSLEYVVKNNASVSRFGDGELRWAIGINSNYFHQESSNELAERLQAIIKSEDSNLMICLPDVFENVSTHTKLNKDTWKLLLFRYRKRWLRLLRPNKQYFDSNMTRPYIDLVDKTQSKEYFELLKKIWNGRDIVLVEGDKTQFGVGNDLLDNAKSVKRIIAPSENAFKRYDEILNIVEKSISKDDLVLIALGPAATVMAYDLYKFGVQAIDIGHADIEYEWFMLKADKRVRLDFKYVNEVPGGDNIKKIENNPNEKKYLSEIYNQIN